MSVTGVLREVIRALVISVISAFFQKFFNGGYFPFCSIIAFVLMRTGCYVSNVKLFTQPSGACRFEAWAIVRNDFLK